MASSQQTKHLTILKILREAVKLAIRTFTLILPVLLLSFLAYSVLFVFFDLSFKPVMADFASNSIAIASLDPKSPEYAIVKAAILKDAKELSAIYAVFLIASFIVSSLTTIATICALTNKLSTAKHFLCRLKGPMITKLYVWLLSSGYFFLLLAVLGAFVLIAGPSSMALIVSGVILALVGTLLYLYLTVVWSVSIVISVVVDGCYGLSAISKARQVIGGRRGQGVVLVLIQFLIISVVSASYNLAVAHVDPGMAQLGIGLAFIAMVQVVAVFCWAAITVFYYDCDGGERTDIEGGFMYRSVPTTEAALRGEV